MRRLVPSSTTTPLTAALIATALTATLLTSCSAGPNDRSPSAPGLASGPAGPGDPAAGAAAAINAFAAGWVKAWAPDGKPQQAAALTDAPASFGALLDGVDTALVVQSVTVTPRGAPRCDQPTTCTQVLDLAAVLRGIGTMKWSSTVTAVNLSGNTGGSPSGNTGGSPSGNTSGSPSGGWQIKADPNTIYPGLGTTNALVRKRTLPARASILDRTGKPLTSQRPVVRLGVNPARANAATFAAFARYFEIDATRLRKRAAAAPAGQMVDVITVRAEDWARVKKAFDPVPGVLEVAATQSLPESSKIARAVLGTLSQVTPELRKNAGDAATTTDAVGASGLQYAFQRRLAGTPGGTVELRDKQTKRLLKTVFQQAEKPGQPLRTTLDLRIQRAAEQSIAGSRLPVHLVAVQASTGNVLAVANGPGPQNYNTAFRGRFAPGSTFKVVTTAALLSSGVRPSSPIGCPNTVTVDGKPFKNYDALRAYGNGTLARALQQSCNTAMITAGMRLGGTALPNAARSFGFGQQYAMALPAYSGSVPAPTSAVDKAASMIGQGRVTASPLQIALTAATVASGTARKPVLVPGRDPAGPAAALPASVATDLRQLMRSVVTSGTARGLAPAGAVAAKTGTAEVVVNGKLTTNGWMMGYRGDLAFAVIVQGGKSGAVAAGPVALAFLRGVR